VIDRLGIVSRRQSDCILPHIQLSIPNKENRNGLEFS
jgi:hypothetical protein